MKTEVLTLKLKIKLTNVRWKIRPGAKSIARQNFDIPAGLNRKQFVAGLIYRALAQQIPGACDLEIKVL